MLTTSTRRPSARILKLIARRRQGRVPLSGYPPSRVNAARLLEAQIARMVARCS